MQQNSQQPSQFLLDAFGGGRRPIETPRSSKHRSHSRSSTRSASSTHSRSPSRIMDDLPPTQSLHMLVPGDSYNSPAAGSPSLMDIDNSPTPVSATLTVFGFPLACQDIVVTLLKSLGHCQIVKSDKPESNWLLVTYSSPIAAQKMLSYDGQIFEGSWFLAVKPGDLMKAKPKPTPNIPMSSPRNQSWSAQPYSESVASSPVPQGFADRYVQPIKMSPNASQPAKHQTQPARNTKQPTQHIQHPSTANAMLHPKTPQLSETKETDRASTRDGLWNQLFSVLFGW